MSSSHLGIGVNLKAAEEARDDPGRYPIAYQATEWARRHRRRVIGWIRRFTGAGVTRFVFRFGSTDPAGDLRLFAIEVLPAFGGERSEATGHLEPVQTHRSEESRWP